MCEKKRKIHEFQINFYKVLRKLLQSATGITKLDKIYWTVLQVLQSVTRSYYEVQEVFRKMRDLLLVGRWLLILAVVFTYVSKLIS